MGLSGISPLSLLLILGIIIALFGTNKIRNVGRDVGHAIKQFKQAVSEVRDKQP